MHATQWTIHGTRLIDENRHIRLATIDVELPDGTRFTQYAAKMPPAAMALVDDEWWVLLMYRHRILIDQWVWELPGGHTVDMAAAAALEVEEETGWRPRTMKHLCTFQPAIGSVDQPQFVYLARGAERTTTAPDGNEAEAIAWFALDEAIAMIDGGEIVGASTIVALYQALSLR